MPVEPRLIGASFPDPPHAAHLLAWYDRHARALPWRANPGAPAPDPYAVWLSEIMLQQTTVAAAAPYYQAFLARWPTVFALAAAEDATVMAAWAGLGYYARARNLLACARAVVASHGGAFPDDEAGLRALPGIGDYTAAAIAAIAFGRRAVVVDANVARVVARLFAISAPLPAAMRAIRSATDRITPDQRSGDFAQAMMDLGATICTSAKPRCLLCPLAKECAAYHEGQADAYPIKALKPAKPLRHGMAFWIERRGAVLLVQRPARGMLAGMRALPDDGWSAKADGDGQRPLKLRWTIAESPIHHVFSHVELSLTVALAEADATLALAGTWWPIERIEESGLPTLFAKAARLALAARAQSG